MKEALYCIALIWMCLSSAEASSQDERELFTYRFQVAEGLNAAEAKVLVHFMSSEPEESCYHVPEADCFKWTTTEALDFPSLEARLAMMGYHLRANALRSDGVWLRRLTGISSEQRRP